MKFILLPTIFCAFLLPLLANAERAVNFRVSLDGDQEVPPVETMASGKALFHVNQLRTTIEFDLEVRNGEDILGAAGAHLHCAPTGENGPIVVFLAGMSVPGFDGTLRIGGTLDEESIINDACGSTVSELVDSMLQGDVYVNVHSTENPSGEIRGQL